VNGERWLSFYWSTERQEIACDGERFAHPIATGTAVSHDVAHLLAAASGLPWKPRASRAAVSFAELNAVLLEHLGGNVLNATLLGCGSEKGVLSQTLEHARWFVDVHYAVFPVSFDEALESFAGSLDVEVVARLAPVFFRTKLLEVGDAKHRERTFRASFSSGYRPSVAKWLRPACDALCRQLCGIAERAPARPSARELS